ncbi:hypothetical protein AX774_g310 [Zancudomyces culisetae]|uniref:Uncharacterized protein n=1 Tax=Zancudomyces culisetae TaxID=1213189 RepID=A0A1R1PYW9_ZANCU|nr:hypothetical protein AX774_g310 [Zancudomyces culisetae]|eukprot:OMH86124.1 hypothetical protein AX774_g310 [Zancudomyces culisetae]
MDHHSVDATAQYSSWIMYWIGTHFCSFRYGISVHSVLDIFQYQHVISSAKDILDNSDIMVYQLLKGVCNKV